MNMTCHPCRGTGRAGGWDNIRGIVVPDCPRCLGTGHVYSRGLAHALEAWRWLRERSREREALARLRSEIGWPHWRVALAPLFVDVAVVMDTLEEASGGIDGAKHTAGHAMWVGRRWAKASGDMVVGGRLSWRQRRAQHAFWQDVCPGVVDLLVAVDEPTQVQMDLMEKRR